MRPRKPSVKRCRMQIAEPFGHELDSILSHRRFFAGSPILSCLALTIVEKSGSYKAPRPFSQRKPKETAQCKVDS